MSALFNNISRDEGMEGGSRGKGPYQERYDYAPYRLLAVRPRKGLVEIRRPVREIGRHGATRVYVVSCRVWFPVFDAGAGGKVLVSGGLTVPRSVCTCLKEKGGGCFGFSHVDFHRTNHKYSCVFLLDLNTGTATYISSVHRHTCCGQVCGIHTCCKQQHLQGPLEENGMRVTREKACK